MSATCLHTLRTNSGKSSESLRTKLKVCFLTCTMVVGAIVVSGKVLPFSNSTDSHTEVK